MKWLILYLIILHGFYPNNSYQSVDQKDVTTHYTPMEALDLVKEKYASDFDKHFMKDTNKEYYYKLPFADYYLEYDAGADTNEEYLFHLYEFVLDEAETGIGHTVTYGWYFVNKESGDIRVWKYYD